MNSGDIFAIKADFADYTDSFGLQQAVRQPGAATGNCLLETSKRVGAYADLGILDDGDIRTFLRAISVCQIRPGLFRRHPTEFLRDLEQEDDLHGLAYAAYKLKKPELAGEILSYLRWHIGFYDNLWPGLIGRPTAFLGRFPALFYQLGLAAGEKPSDGFDAWTAASIEFSAVRAGRAQDPWVLNKLILDTVDGRSERIMNSESVFRREFSKAWPGGWPELFTVYYSGDDQNPFIKHTSWK